MAISPDETPALSGELILAQHTSHAPTESELVELWMRNITASDGWTQLFRMRRAGEPVRRVVVYVVREEHEELDPARDTGAHGETVQRDRLHLPDCRGPAQ